MAYTTLDEVKAFIGISDDVTAEENTLLTNLIGVAQETIDAYCRRTFEAAADSSRSFDCLSPTVSGRFLYLDADLCSITTITNGDGEAVATSEYRTMPAEAPWFALELLPGSGKSWTHSDDPQQAIVISGRWSYSTSAPPAVVHATNELVGWLYRSYDRQGELSISAASVGGQDGKNLPPVVTMLLESYRGVV